MWKDHGYGIGVLESQADDINHFDPNYFAGVSLARSQCAHNAQAYRRLGVMAKEPVSASLTRQLEASLRCFLGLLLEPFDSTVTFPKTAILDFTHVEWMCATGIVKKNMFSGWEKNSLPHVQVSQYTPLIKCPQ